MDWRPIKTLDTHIRGKWVVLADIDPSGKINLAHADVIVSEIDVWYLTADPNMFTHWKPLEAEPF